MTSNQRRRAFSFGAAAVMVLGMTLGAAAKPPTAPTPVPTPQRQLREIGTIRARTPYCTAFVTHFNNSVQGLTTHDGSIGAVDFTLTDVTKSFDDMAGELRRSDDRRKLAAYADRLLRDIPATQAEIDALRNASTLTTDPATARENRELAKQLQRALDRQKQIAIDTGGIVRALMEYDSGVKSAAASHLPGSYDDNRTLMPPDMLDVKKYVRIQELRDRIGDAESEAAGHADTIQEKC